MKNFVFMLKFAVITLSISMIISCSADVDKQEKNATSKPEKANTNTQKSNFRPREIPKLQREIINEKDSKTESPLGKVDFKNHTYPLPRGWQDRDGKELELKNGFRRMTEEKIGMSFVTTKYFDVTGDDEDEAFVILKVGTGSITIPQIVYVFEWKENEPSLLWYFRTGDRSAGGLKKIYGNEGNLVIELFGRDRYIFTQMETSKIVGDEEDLCCPTHYTRSIYKRQGKGFSLSGDRLTFSMGDPDAEPVTNMNDKKLKEERGSKQ